MEGELKEGERGRKGGRQGMYLGGRRERVKKGKF